MGQPMPSEGDYLEGMIVNGPRRQDVASTRDHKWHTHEQNVFYRELVHKAVTNMKTFDAESFKNAADRIVNIILIDKQGVFVKDYATGWIVMSRKETHNKVQQALRNYQRKLEGYNRPQKRKQSSKKKFPVTAKKRILQAQGGTEASIHPYALLLISAVCNKHEPLDALRVLDNPLSQCFTDGEPPKERTMRLQLRQRYAGALSMGIAPITFSERLLELWGGSLTRIDPNPLPPEPEKTAPATASVPNSDQNGQKSHEPTDLELLMGLSQVQPRLLESNE